MQLCNFLNKVVLIQNYLVQHIFFVPPSPAYKDDKEGVLCQKWGLGEYFLSYDLITRADNSLTNSVHTPCNYVNEGGPAF
jgi:hypothetical protein